METITEQLTLEEVFSRMDKSYELNWVDYRDSFDDNLQPIQDAINEQSMESVYDANYEWLGEQSWQTCIDIEKELESELKDDFDEDEVEKFFEEHDEEIREEIYNRDESNVFRRLFNNTKDVATFFDTGMYIEDCSFDAERQKDNYKVIKKTLGIKGKDFDKQIYDLMINAGYGGRLVIYFNPDLQDKNTIQFTNPFVAIIDNYNGSGSDAHFEGLTVTLPYEPMNVFIDKLLKYNYTHEVCGMYSDWCGQTGVKLLETKSRKQKPEKSTLHQLTAQEKRFNKTFKEGKCSAGDMDIRRHRHTYYINDFPCGTKCKDCGTFWID
jgi:hypothetical protein